MNTNNKQEIVEDAPIMRSVAMHSPLAMSPLVRSSSSSSSSSPLSKSAPSRIPVAASTTGTACTDTTASPTWKVQQLVQLPSMYLLERTNVYVSDTKPELIAQRIAECLRTQSIAATFTAKETTVRCETPEHVLFSIRLWSDKDQVVVEVQRAAGCCFLFCQATKAILRAAKGDTAVQPARCFTLPACVPQQSLEEQKQLIQDDLENCASLLKKDRHDAHVLAMESLCHLSKTTRNRAFAAHCILRGDFLSTLLCLVESYRMSPCDSEIALSEMQEQHFQLLHCHALTILGNCLGAIDESGELSLVLQNQPELASKSLLACLVLQISSSQEHPHNACQAVRCLKSLVRACPEIKQAACALGAFAAVGAAHQQGVCRHTALEQESAALQNMLL